jgi:hypothetical protein
MDGPENKREHSIERRFSKITKNDNANPSPLPVESLATEQQEVAAYRSLFLPWPRPSMVSTFRYAQNVLSLLVRPLVHLR